MALKDRIPGMPGRSDDDSQDEDEDSRDPRNQYHCMVNKGGLNVRVLTALLNRRWRSGWKLGHIIEQHGNTVLVFERRP